MHTHTMTRTPPKVSEESPKPSVQQSPVLGQAGAEEEEDDDDDDVSPAEEQKRSRGRERGEACALHTEGLCVRARERDRVSPCSPRS